MHAEAVKLMRSWMIMVTSSNLEVQPASRPSTDVCLPTRVLRSICMQMMINKHFGSNKLMHGDGCASSEADVAKPRFCLENDGKCMKM